MDMRKVGATPLKPETTSKLLDLLSTDDQFRDLFRSDASAALASIGYEVPEGEASAALCLQLHGDDQLASKEKFARDREKLEQSLNVPVSFLIRVDYLAE